MTEYINPFTIFLLSVFGAGIGAYVGSYLRERARTSRLARTSTG
jgi:hypothetical protein